MMLRKLLASAALVIAANAASAATCQYGTEADFTENADVWTSTNCVGQISDPVNDSASAMNSYAGGNGVFDINNWSLNSKWEEDDGSYSPAGILSIVDNGDKTGNWMVDSWAGIGSAALVVKGGTGWAAYLLDMTAGLSGGWSVFALTNKGGQTPDISHISLYTTPEMAPIPLPASGLLLVAGLGGFAAMRRRKKS